MVPQSCQKEKVNRLKLKIFLIGHIYEVNIISINKLCNANNFYFINMSNKKIFNLSLLTFSFWQLCGTILRFIFYKCDLWPKLTHSELQTAEFGRNLVKRAKFFVFNLMVFSSYHLLWNHIKFHLVP